MLLGDTSKIAVLYDVVEEWSDETWKNGLFNIIISDEYVMNEVLVSTINSELLFLSRKLEKIKKDTFIFSLNKEEAFEKIYLKVYPNDINKDNDYSYCLTPNEFKDYEIFAVTDGNKIRILYGQVTFDGLDFNYSNAKGVIIKEIFIENDDIEVLRNKICKSLDIINGRNV